MHQIDLKSHNWPIYKIHNDFFREHKHLIRYGVLDLGCGLSLCRPDMLDIADEYIGVDANNGLDRPKRFKYVHDISRCVKTRLNWRSERAATVAQRNRMRGSSML